MIDGKPYKMLKHHLSLNGYTPQSYRETFGLPRYYPMVRPSMLKSGVTSGTRSGLVASRKNS